MKSGDLAAFLSEALGIKTNTVLDYAKHLRATKPRLLSKGTRGRYAGADMTSTDAVNWLLALVLDHGYGDSIAANVRRVRDLYHDEAPAIAPDHFTEGLTCFRAAQAGKAIENLVDDFQSGRIALWAEAEDYELAVTLDVRGESLFMWMRNELGRANQGFAVPGFMQRKKRLIERNVTFSSSFFRQLAEKLGPL